MTAAFHLFPFLPWELREEIWKLGIRPSVSGAHVFQVYDASDPEAQGPEHEATREIIHEDDYGYYLYDLLNAPCLVAPRHLPRGASARQPR